MSKTQKNSLIIAVVTLALDLFVLGGDFAWGVLKPVGAVALVIFLIAYAIEDELKRFDEEFQKGEALYDRTTNPGGNSSAHGGRKH